MARRRTAESLAGLALVLNMAGCASVVGKSAPQVVKIDSTPGEADVVVSDVDAQKEIFKGKTPALVSLEKKKGYFKGRNYSAAVSKPGYQSYVVPLRPRVNGWYALGNLFVPYAGIAGWLAVDPLTGAMWSYRDRVDVKLEQGTGTVVAERPSNPLRRRENPSVLPETSLSLGGATGTGRMSDFGGSFHAGLSFDVPAGKNLLAGFEFSGNGRHVVDEKALGPAAPPFISEVNVAHAGLRVKAPFRLAGDLSARPVLGLGYYQLNFYERHGHFDKAGNYLGHTDPMPRVDTKHYFGGSGGLALVLEMGESFSVGPEVRFHQLANGGRFGAPSFLTTTLSLSTSFH
ncbi:MAG: hypothetical protein ACT4O3_00025 [Elusimicrobiota bacterium]